MISAEGFGLFIVRVLVLASASALLAEAAARMGNGLLPFVHRRSISALERLGLGLLLGFSTLGFVYFGLALAGLFTPLALAGAGLALLGGSRAMWQRRLLLAEAIRESRAAGVLGLVALALGLAPMAWKLLLPEGNPDSWAYHLGIPWQYLQAGRAVYEYVPLTFHYPSPFETAFALPLIAGDDRLAKVMVLLCFMASSMVFAARCLKLGRPNAAWLGPLLVMSFGGLALLATTSKSDVPAASLFIAGATLQLAGAWAPGAFLLGLCLASKLVYGPIVAVWCLCFPPLLKSATGRIHIEDIEWKRVGWWAALLLLPSIPWLMKSYLVMGNPLYPFASEWFPSLDWSAANQEVHQQYLGVELESRALQHTGLLVAWFTTMKGYLPVLLGLPVLILWSRHRRAAIACVAAQFLLLAMSHKMRYVMPTTWLLALLMAEEVGRLPGRLKTVSIGALGVYALAAISLSPGTYQPGWKKVWASVLQLQPRLTTYLEVEPWLTRPGRAAVSWRPGAPRVRRVLTIGELRTYSFPFRLLSNGIWGMTPVVWKFVNESGDVAELSKKFKQLGAKRLLFNYVSVEFSTLWYDAFPWKKEQLRRYVEFCKRHLVRLGRSERSDFISGGFYVYEIRRQPLASPPSEIWFAPGTEAVYGPGLRFENQRRKEEALKVYLKALALLPDVGHAWNHVGHAYALLNDSPNAFRYLKKFGEEGMMDSMNLGEFGAHAVRVGELDLGERVLEDALPRYPAYRKMIRLNQVTLWVMKASRLLDARHLKEAEPWMHKARKVMDQVSVMGDQGHKDLHRDILAMVLALEGNYELMRGEWSKAADYFLESYRTAPNHPLAKARKVVGERLKRQRSRISSP